MTLPSKWLNNVLLTPKESREIDNRTIAETGVTGLELMERAGEAAAKHILRLFPKPGTALFLLGKGNNAGDGYVIARVLLTKGWKILFCPLFNTPPSTPDAKTNYDYFYSDNPTLFEEIDQEDIQKFNPTIVLDCLFGTGYHGILDQTFQTLFDSCNRLHTYIIGIDGPSGLDGETGKAGGNLLNCDLTFSFGRSKVGFQINDGPMCCGKVTTIDIGFPKEFESPRIFELGEFIRPTNLSSFGKHKYENGVVHVVAGSSQYIGAPLLCAKAAHSLSLGAIFLHIPAKIVSSITPNVPPDTIVIGYGEAKSECFTELDIEQIKSNISQKPGSVVVGPGIGRSKKTEQFIRRMASFLAENDHIKSVIDADALTLLGSDLPIFTHNNSVLTPHRGEAKNFGISWKDDNERMEEFEKLAHSKGVNILSKGNPAMFFSTSGRIWIGSYPTFHFSYAGMGDILSGLIGAYSTHFGIEEATLNAIAHLNNKYHVLRHSEERLNAGNYVSN